MHEWIIYCSCRCLCAIRGSLGSKSRSKTCICLKTVDIRNHARVRALVNDHQKLVQELEVNSRRYSPVNHIATVQPVHGRTKQRPNNEYSDSQPLHTTVKMREVSRSLLSPLLADIRFLVCEHASPRPGGYPRQTGLHSRNPQMRQAHNLSNRYKILENNLRPHRQTPKGEAVGDTLEGTLDVFQSPTKSPKDTPEAGEMEVMNRGGSKSILRPKPRTFGGVLIPVKPQPPAPDGTLFVPMASLHAV